MNGYPRKFWYVAVLTVSVACLTLFIPFPVVEDITGISFRAFFVIVSLIELVCAVVIYYQFSKYRPSQEERENRSEWDYNP